MICDPQVDEIKCGDALLITILSKTQCLYYIIMENISVAEERWQGKVRHDEQRSQSDVAHAPYPFSRESRQITHTSLQR